MSRVYAQYFSSSIFFYLFYNLCSPNYIRIFYIPQNLWISCKSLFICELRIHIEKLYVMGTTQDKKLCIVYHIKYIVHYMYCT